MTEHYPQHYGGRAFRKEVTRKERRTDDRRKELDQEEKTIGQSKKDKRRWCKGRVGIEHDPEWVLYHEFTHCIYYRLRCKTCGKVLDWKREEK